MKKGIAVIGVVAILSASTAGCGSTIQRVSTEVNNAIQTKEFADTADKVSEATWHFAVYIANQLSDFCEKQFGGSDAGGSDSSGAGSSKTTGDAEPPVPTPDTGGAAETTTGAGATENAAAEGTE